MPQTRTVLQATDALQVERVSLHPLSAEWSPSYEVATARVVLPARGASEFRFGGRHVLLDGLTALCLPTGVPYQMKPLAERARTSIVVSAQPGADAGLPPPDCWLLSAAALWRLRQHWQALAPGRAGSGRAPNTEVLLQSLLHRAARVTAGKGRASTAVERARRFMVARTLAADGQSWSLHDVADAACCSPFHLARTFRSHTGLSLHAYRQRLRLATALQRLEDGERDLAALAHELGYSSQSHLGSVFVREFGVTPAQARRELSA